MTNFGNSVIYTGVTNNLKRRVQEHKNKIGGIFTSKYNLTKLVYYELLAEPYYAIQREKQIKAGSRIKKIKLIETMNPRWQDLFENI